jgi:hypothetical protein
MDRLKTSDYFNNLDIMNSKGWLTGFCSESRVEDESRALKSLFDGGSVCLY